MVHALSFSLTLTTLVACLSSNILLLSLTLCLLLTFCLLFLPLQLFPLAFCPFFLCCLLLFRLLLLPFQLFPLPLRLLLSSLLLLCRGLLQHVLPLLLLKCTLLLRLTDSHPLVPFDPLLFQAISLFRCLDRLKLRVNCLQAIKDFLKVRFPSSTDP